MAEPESGCVGLCGLGEHESSSGDRIEKERGLTEKTQGILALRKFRLGSKGKVCLSLTISIQIELL